MAHELILPEAPVTAEQLQYASPRLLLAYDRTLGGFASNPRRLTPHITLAAHRDPLTPRDIANELTAAAGYDIPSESDKMDTLTQRVSDLLHAKHSRSGPYTRTVGRHTLEYNAAGHQIVPTVVLLAGHWLLDRDRMEKLMPPAPGIFVHHEIRLACLQACLRTGTTLRAAAQKIEVSMNQVRHHFTDLESAGLIRQTGTQAQSRYIITADAKPFVTTLVTEIHSLKEPSYTNALRKIVPEIVGTPDLYGTLARAAIDGFLGQQESGSI